MRKLLCITVFMGLSAVSSVGLSYRQSKPSDFSFEDLVEIVKSKQPTTIESLLPMLPRSMRDQYASIYRSRSVQDASFQFPRIIMFGNDASTLMAFNGDPSQKGFDRLEVIQFREKTASFEFRELFFDGKSLPQISEPNPSKCLKCHQSPTRTDIDPRPNWEPYNAWPGVYGSVDGLVDPTVHQIYSKVVEEVGNNRELLDLVDLMPREREEFSHYRSRTAPHPRYGHLGDYNGDFVLNFTQRVAQLNFRRIARLMKRFPPFYTSALDARIRCRSDQSELPKNLAAFHRAEYLRTEHMPMKSDDKIPYLSYLFEPLGEDTNDWSMTFNTEGRFALSNRFGTPGNHDLEFPPLIGGTDSCEELVIKIKQEGEAFVPTPRTQLDRVRPLLNACAKCHSGLTPVAPPIAFDDFKTLGLQLKRPGYPRGTLFEEIRYRLSEEADPKLRMPEGFHFAPFQNKLLIDYLTEL